MEKQSSALESLRKEPALSFIVPVYNVESYLSECVDSLLRISLLAIEVILVDDGSTDRSGEIADCYARQDPRIKVIHQSNRGLSGARNRGMEEATGTYLAFVDSDDWLIGDRIVEIYRNALRFDANMAMGNALFYYPDGTTDNPFAPIPPELTGIKLTGKQCFTELMKRNLFAPMVYDYLYKREWVRKQAFRFHSVMHEDELWTPVALCQAERTVVTNIDFYNYRQRAGSIMSTLRKEKRIPDLIYIANRLIRFAERFSFTGEDREVKSMLYVKIFCLYRLAFAQAGEIRNGNFKLPPHHHPRLMRVYPKLSPFAQKVCLNHYRIARLGWKEYLKWKFSKWVKDVTPATIEGKKLILVYNTMWKSPLPIPFHEIPEGYVYTTDRRYLDRADAVVFHLPTLKSELEDDLEKPDGQKWIAWSLECEENYPILKDEELMELFDYKMTYHQHADIIYPYYTANHPRLFRQMPDFEQKTGQVCALISSRINKSGREKYLQELMQHIEIDSYGRLFNNRKMEQDTGRDAKIKLYSRYKFVIAFENSCAPDYVTEKFFDPLTAGAVPIYLGAPNIDRFAPGKNCFVDVRDFDSPPALAAFINECCRDEGMYRKFFEWKKEPLAASFLAKTEIQQVNPFIRLCGLIR